MSTYEERRVAALAAIEAGGLHDCITPESYAVLRLAQPEVRRGWRKAARDEQRTPEAVLSRTELVVAYETARYAALDVVRRLNLGHSLPQEAGWLVLRAHPRLKRWELEAGLLVFDQLRQLG